MHEKKYETEDDFLEKKEQKNKRKVANGGQPIRMYVVVVAIVAIGVTAFCLVPACFVLTLSTAVDYHRLRRTNAVYTHVYGSTTAVYVRPCKENPAFSDPPASSQYQGSSAHHIDGFYYR